MDLKSPKDGLLFDQPNRYARRASIELGPETLVHGYQEFRLTSSAVQPLPTDPLLCRKHQLLQNIFDPDYLRGRSLLDVGANGGFFSFWARQRGASSVVALDMDEAYLVLIRSAQAHHRLEGIRTISSRVQDWNEPADIVLAFAMVHWLFSCTATYGTLEAVVRKLKELSRQLLVVEWISPEDSAITSFNHTAWNPSAVRGPYNREAFEDALREHFPRVEILGNTTPTRILYAAWLHPNEITIDEEMPLLGLAEKVLSSRCLARQGAKKYFSRIYRCDDDKLLWKQATDDLAFREASFLAELRGPRFPRAFKNWQESRYSVLWLEYVRGSGLRQSIPSIASTPKSLARFFEECLFLLQDLQTAGILHRDIRAENILVRNGRPVLIDFGWAQKKGESCLTPPGLGDEGRPPDGSFCDVYALGKVFALATPRNSTLFIPLVQAMTTLDRASRLTRPSRLRALLRGLKLPDKWEDHPRFGFVNRDSGASVAEKPRFRPVPASKAIHSGRMAQRQVNPLVSIIIPVFNQLELTEQCLQALRLNTPLERCEILVVDNGSVDATPARLTQQQTAGSPRVLRNEENLGFAKACNQGARAAKGKYLLFLNNDTQVQPDWLLPLLSLIEADTKVAAVGSKLLYPDGTIQHAGVALAQVEARDPLVALHCFHKAENELPAANERRIYQALTAACILVRRSSFEEVGGFDEEFWNGYEDVDFCLRLQERGWVCVYEPTSCVVHYESQSGPARFERVDKNIARLHQKWLGKVRLDFLIKTDGTTSPSEYSLIRPYQRPTVAEALVSIIILVHNGLDYTKQCLASIEQHTAENYEIILVDNGSEELTSAWLRVYAASRPGRHLIRNSTNFGFAAGNNQALTLARGQFVLLLNNDTVVAPAWLQNMLAVLQRHPRVGIVGPRSNRVAGLQLVEHPAYDDLQELALFAKDWAQQHSGSSRRVSRVIGFCLLARRSVIEAVGGLDEQFGSGNFEDDDFCIRAGLAGFEIQIADDAFVHHLGGQTFHEAGVDYRQAMSTNWELFKSKWNFPADLAMEAGYPAPNALPVGRSLKFPLADLNRSHSLMENQKVWTEKGADRLTISRSPERTVTSRPAELPPCALVGSLLEAKSLLQSEQLREAWEATRRALHARPFHPEAYLLFAEIALAGGDGASACSCAEQARQLAPAWSLPRKFLASPLPGNDKPEWLVLPESVLLRSGSLARKPSPSLSLCLIVRNEADFLGQCLASVQGLADQLIVVDTGSTDRTVDIAREHGAHVFHFTWRDDFSAARNAALEHATSDWILMLDADEELPATSHEALRKLVQCDAVMAWRLPMVDVGREEEGCSYVPRLFRNAPSLFYVGCIHEQVFHGIETRRQQWGLENRLGDAVIHHHGYKPQVVQARGKVQRNLCLLVKAIEECPDEPALLMNYGLELTRSGHLEQGILQYRKAFETMSRQPPAQVVPETREMLLTQFSSQLMALKEFTEIIRVLCSPLAATGKMSASLHFTLGLAWLEIKDYSRAADEMRACLAKRDSSSLAPINKEIRQAGPNHCLALCLDRLGDKEGAANHFRQAIQDSPGARRPRIDYARFLVERAKPVEALNVLFALVSEPNTDVEAWVLGGEIALSQLDFLEVALDWTHEAIRNVPAEPQVRRHRAEALMLSSGFEEALPLWRQLSETQDPMVAAAVVVCETILDKCSFMPASDCEPAISAAFVKWYQRLIAYRAQEPLERINMRLESLRLILPTAANMLAGALAEAGEASLKSNGTVPIYA